MISLGCPKNVVDAEELLGQVEIAGHDIVTDPARAEVLIVNTCGFIQSAKEESIDAILDAVRYRTNGACRSLIVTGCLVQRYGNELSAEIPEADALVGLGGADQIAETIARTLAGERLVDVRKPSAWWTAYRKRVLSTSPWTAYLRIADGCDNRCTYCAIPDIRGSFRSRPERVLLEEARALAESGVKELNLVAQDVTRYGLDAEGALTLPRLLDELAAIEGVSWIRLLYCYPTRITDELIRTVADNEKVCEYLDIPLQHCADRILKAMGRAGGKDDYLRTIDLVRERCADVAVRTTFITGFPGETEADFGELMEFVEQVRFDRAGVFTYSDEDGTPASGLPDKVHASSSRRRARLLMELQQGISLARNREMIGRRMEVLVEYIEDGMRVARSRRDAPEIDGLVYVEGSSAQPGDFANVLITGARAYDLIACACEHSDRLPTEKDTEVLNG